MGGGLMAKVELPYVHSYVDRHGHPRHYFRRHGKRTRLPAPGAPEFMGAYTAANACAPAPAPKPREKAKEGTFAALASFYFGSAQYRSLAAASRRVYRLVIDRFLMVHGHRQVTEMKREHVVKIIGSMADRPGAAGIMLKRIRTLIKFGMDIGWVTTDPTHRVRAYKGKEFHTWTEDEIAQFEERWPIGSPQRLAFALCLYTGQRGSDVHRMTWADIAGAAIKVAQQKTKARLTIPLHSELQKVLAVAPKNHVAILTTAYGAAFSVKGFGQFMSAATAKAGLGSHCKTHGLRKAAARRLAEAGCSANQIASITGHKTLAEVERYTRAADQEKLSRQAIERQEGNALVATPEQPQSATPKKTKRTS